MFCVSGRQKFWYLENVIIYMKLWTLRWKIFKKISANLGATYQYLHIWFHQIWKNVCVAARRECLVVRYGGRVVEHWTVNWGDCGSIQPAAVSKHRQFNSLHICLCLSEETLKAGGPFCLVSMSGEVNDPKQGANV